MNIVSKILGIINGTNPANPTSGKRVLFAKSDGWYDKNSAGVTAKLATTSDISAPYLVYTALLTQSGTDAPVATVLENTLGGTPVWSRQASGTFRATLTNLFTSNKSTAFVANDYVNGNSEHSTGSFTADDYYEMYTYTMTNVVTDNVSFAIEIRVYP